MDRLIETIKDTYLMIPILCITYIVLEYLEHKNEKRSYEKIFLKYGPLCGAFLGVLPQCALSVMSSLLFIEGKITLGTLISVFIATSDEAIPLLLTNPQMYSSLLLILLLKVILAIIIGYSVDLLVKQRFYPKTFIQEKKHDEHHVFKQALTKTLKIYSFVFLISFALSYCIDLLGEEQLSNLLMNHSLLQPLVCALFGFIPNCAASVILTQLYMHHTLSFASLLSGLMTNAGLGIVVLLKNRISLKMIFKICLILFSSATLVGFIIQWFFFL